MKMFKGSYCFAKEAAFSKRHRGKTVCEGTTATCGPPGHPCETCMHLKGVQPIADADRDLCLIAPRSLLRPVQYKRYFNRGVHVPPYLPVSKVSGEMKEVPVPEPCGSAELQEIIERNRGENPKFKFKDAGETETPYMISNNVYIEHNGRFTKAPKHLLELGDYSTRICYLEDFRGPQFESPLDSAILIQKLWTLIIKIVFGLLAGVKLMDVTLGLSLLPNAEEDDLAAFFNTYPRVCYIFFVTTSVFTILTIIALFDWLDMAHLNVQHVWDTYLHRTIWMVTLPVFFAYIMFLLNADMNDALFLHGVDWSDYEIEEARAARVTENLPLRKALDFWQVRGLGTATFLFASWILLVITRNDDLFLMHLQCMKKYDYYQTRHNLRKERIMVNPHQLPA